MADIGTATSWTRREDEIFCYGHVLNPDRILVIKLALHQCFLMSNSLDAYPGHPTTEAAHSMMIRGRLTSGLCLQLLNTINHKALILALTSQQCHSLFRRYPRVAYVCDEQLSFYFRLVTTNSPIQVMQMYTIDALSLRSTNKGDKMPIQQVCAIWNLAVVPNECRHLGLSILSLLSKVVKHENTVKNKLNIHRVFLSWQFCLEKNVPTFPKTIENLSILKSWNPWRAWGNRKTSGMDQ